MARTALDEAFTFYTAAVPGPRTLTPAADCATNGVLAHFLGHPNGTRLVDTGTPTDRPAAVVLAAMVPDRLEVVVCTQDVTCPDTTILDVDDLTAVTGWARELYSHRRVRLVHVQPGRKGGYLLREVTDLACPQPAVRAAFYLSTKNPGWHLHRAPVRQADVPQSATPQVLLDVLDDLHTGAMAHEWTTWVWHTQRYYLNCLAGLGLTREHDKTWALTDAGEELAAAPAAVRPARLARLLDTTVLLAAYRSGQAHRVEKTLAWVERVAGVNVTLRAGTLARRCHQLAQWAAWCDEQLAPASAVRPVAVGPLLVSPPDLGRQLTTEELAAHRTEVDQRFLDRVADLDPFAFEQLVGHLFAAAGVMDVEVTQRSGDGGIDVRGWQLVAGVVRVPVVAQVKRWKANVGIDEVQRLRGSLRPGEVGVLYTTSGYTKAARDDAENHPSPVRLADGAELAELARQFQVGVECRPGHAYEISDFTEFTD